MSGAETQQVEEQRHQLVGGRGSCSHGRGRGPGEGDTVLAWRADGRWRRREAGTWVEADRRRQLLSDACDDDDRLEISCGVRLHILD